MGIRAKNYQSLKQKTWHIQLKTLQMLEKYLHNALQKKYIFLIDIIRPNALLYRFIIFIWLHTKVVSIMMCEKTGFA